MMMVLDSLNVVITCKHVGGNERLNGALTNKVFHLM